MPDARLYWLTDWDGDGAPFGLEHALGTDALRSDPAHPRNLTPPAFDAQNRAQLTFGVNNAALPGTLWKLTRSTTLLPGSFTEIFRFDGTAYTFNNAQTLVLDNGDAFTVIDRASRQSLLPLRSRRPVKARNAEGGAPSPSRLSRRDTGRAAGTNAV